MKFAYVKGLEEPQAGVLDCEGTTEIESRAKGQGPSGKCVNRRLKKLKENLASEKKRNQNK